MSWTNKDFQRESNDSYSFRNTGKSYPKFPPPKHENICGSWISSFCYEENATVFCNGITWICVKSNCGKMPHPTSCFWRKLCRERSRSKERRDKPDCPCDQKERSPSREKSDCGCGKNKREPSRERSRSRPRHKCRQFATFFGLTTGTGSTGNDYSTPIAVKTTAGTGRVPFPRTAVTNGEITNNVGASSFILPSIGTYEVSFNVVTVEQGQLTLELNGVDLVYTTMTNYDNVSGGSPITGRLLVTTFIENSELALINPTANALPLTITIATGSLTHANSQTLTIVRIA